MSKRVVQVELLPGDEYYSTPEELEEFLVCYLQDAHIPTSIQIVELPDDCFEYYRKVQQAEGQLQELIQATKQVIEHFQWETSGGPEQAAYDKAMQVLNQIALKFNIGGGQS